MRIIALAVTFGSLITGAALVAQSNEPAPDRFDMPSYQDPARSWRDIEDPIERARCEEQIRKARSDAGQPEIEREPADPEKPLMLAAVHQTIEDCPVLVMKQDTSDIRPVPERRERSLAIEKID